MTNAELIKALRYCAEHDGCDYYIAKDCPRESTWVCGADCEQILMHDAANAIEAAEKRIAELEDDLLNGTISNPERFEIYGYKVKDLLLFADMCKRNDVREADLKQAAWNLELAVRAYHNATIENFRAWEDETGVYASCRYVPNFEKAYAEMKGEHDGKQ